MKTLIIANLLSLLLSTGNTPVLNGANPSNIATTPYGTATRDYQLIGDTEIIVNMGLLEVPLKSKMVSSLHYHFNSPASGTFTIEYMKNMNTKWELYIEGGMLLSATTSGMTIKVTTGVIDVYVTMMIDDTPSNAGYIGQMFSPIMRNQNITLGDTEYTIIQNMDSQINYIAGEAQQIVSNTNTTKNILQSALGGYVNNDGSLYTDMQTLKDTLNTINTTIQKLETVEWNDIYYTPSFSNSLTGTYSSTYVQGNDVYLKFSNASTVLYNKNPIYKIRLPIKYLSNQNRFNDGLSIKIYGVTGGTYNLMDYEIIQYSTYYNYLNIYFRMFNSCYDFVIHVHDPDYIISSDNNVTSSYGQYITEDVIDYWTVLNILNQNKMTDRIVDAINNMSFNVNNLSVITNGITYNTNITQVDNSVTNYQNNINLINNVENNFKDMFDNANLNYNVDNIPITNDMINTNNFMNNIATQLYGIDIIKYPVTLLLLGIVLIGLLG